jgi:hypothetical protein
MHGPVSLVSPGRLWTSAQRPEAASRLQMNTALTFYQKDVEKNAKRETKEKRRRVSRRR